MRLVGSTTVLDTTNNMNETIHIFKSRGLSKRIYTALIMKDGKYTELGAIGFRWLREIPPSQIVTDEVGFPGKPVLYKYITETKGDPRGIYISSIYGQESHKGNQYKGVGTALVHAVFEYALRKLTEGRIALDAGWSSHIFYYKLGFDSEQKADIEKIYEKSIEEKTVPDTSDLDLCHTWLPLETIKKWEEESKENPILRKMKEGNTVSKTITGLTIKDDEFRYRI